MKPSKLLLGLVLIVIVVGIAGFSIRERAQESVIGYLKGKFQEQNISVVDITILKEVPLHVRVIVQSKNEWITTDDMVTLNSVKQIVFFDARQDGYEIKRLVSILQDDQGRQLDYTEESVDDNRFNEELALNKSLPQLTDEETKALLLAKIDPVLDHYDVRGVPIVWDVSSKDGDQTLNLALQTSSLDVANRAALFFWALPNFAILNEIKAEGANLISYRAKITDENGNNLLDLTHNFRSGSGGWTQSEKLRDLGEGPPPGP